MPDYLKKNLKNIRVGLALRNLRPDAKIYVAAVLCVAAGFLLWLFQPSKSIAVVDLHEAMAKPSRLLSQSQYSGKEQQKIMSLYSGRLLMVLKAYGEKHHKTIIEGRVLSNGSHLDVTDEVVRLTMEEIRHG